MPFPDSIPHPTVSQVKIIENKTNFPISWLNKQGYCEYGIFLENVRQIKTAPTAAMVKGVKEHAVLEENFKEEAVPATFDEMLESSKTGELLSREFPVVSANYGIRGFIDEIWMTPDEFIIIDDKPGVIPYYSSINQVYGYCLAFKDMVGEDRQIVASLRERGTDNIFWASYFDAKAEKSIIGLIDHVHDLISGNTEFGSTDNPNKCRKCRFNKICDRRV
ncbi:MULTISPECIES: CRISPR-associated protein Cas4 [Methanobacterium]|uniref:CRISPR-associated protein Cas4 n=1 Tax=Methanobacterium bryantii TaxID=2161 RepID=A0A2A2H2R2_METBR|nr:MULTISPECIES: CRISPR-associated protein Cas4 [Methanobacterium]OEC86474.1 CRISPR-associated protein Cas4 [Methanobacterium sp. A39]PAV03647.1 CRISPR-associated protein Cas4 [Methanobacterium bryantii]